MMRLPPRFATWLLWIAIALLPLRGWAAASMAAPGAAVEVAVTVAADDRGDHAHGTPCHGAVHDETVPAGSTPHDCSLCDLCHAGVAWVSAEPPSLLQLPQGVPQAASASVRETGAIDGVFRPPRRA